MTRAHELFVFSAFVRYRGKEDVRVFIYVNCKMCRKVYQKRQSIEQPRSRPVSQIEPVKVCCEIKSI